MRLRSGIAPLNAFIEAGLTVALGIDEAGLNDDRDMLQEMRLVLKQHRVPGVGADDVPHAAEVFRMATEGGARTTPFDSEIGTLAPGSAADLVLLDWTEISKPYLDADLPVIEAILHRAKSGAVDAVMVGGEVVYQTGRFTRIDRDVVLSEFAERLASPLSVEEHDRRKLARDLLPHVRAMYADNWDAGSIPRPFYRGNARD
jgi:cytosine/adenosine deaminase-related metal-dependent hydrolase